VIGIVVLHGANDSDRQLLGILAAIGFILIDVTYAIRGRISKVYLADGLAQLLFIAAWILT
jgi:hypothetical protein